MGDELKQGAALAETGWRELARWALRRRRMYQVNGESMIPVLNPGDAVLVDPRAYRHRTPALGEIVVAQHPYRTDVIVIKRVGTVLPDGSCRLVGDNPAASTDSRSYGAVPASKLLGRVTSRW